MWSLVCQQYLDIFLILFRYYNVADLDEISSFKGTNGEAWRLMKNKKSKCLNIKYLSVKFSKKRENFEVAL